MDVLSVSLSFRCPLYPPVPGCVNDIMWNTLLSVGPGVRFVQFQPLQAVLENSPQSFSSLGRVTKIVVLFVSSQDGEGRFNVPS